MVSCVLVVLACLASATSSAAADTLTFLVIPGIPGESVVRGYENAIDLYSVTQSFTAGAKAGTACTVTFTKGIDRSGPLLWAAAVTGQILPDVRLDIVRAGDLPVRFYTLVLTNATVVSITSNPSALAENVTLSGATATMTYYPQKADGTAGTPVSSTATCK
jgi:type VI secretion system Hcp family effector